MKVFAVVAVGSLFVLSACSEGPVATAPEEAPASLYAPGLDDTFRDLGLQHHTGGGEGDRFLSLIVPGDILNGGFESNGGPNSTTLNDWATFNAGSGAVFAQTGTQSPNGFPVPAPPEGDFAAMSSQGGPGLHIWYQDITVPAGRSELRFQLFIANRFGAFFTPATLSHTGGANQQFRADIMDPGAPLADVGAGVLANLYQTQPGDQLVMDSYTSVVFDLSAFSGQSVRLRFAQVDNRFFFNAATDDVVIERLDPETKDDCKKGGWEAFGFRNQGLCVSFVETGRDTR